MHEQKRRGRPRKENIERELIHERELANQEDVSTLIQKQIRATISLLHKRIPLDESERSYLQSLLERLVKTVRQFKEEE